MTLAGLWERWQNHENDLEMETVSIVTTTANHTMKKIHNNPEMLKRQFSEKSRMPVIIPRGMEKKWTNTDILDMTDQEILLKEINQLFL